MNLLSGGNTPVEIMPRGLADVGATLSFDSLRQFRTSNP
jgi:hypothetical protein